MTGLQGAIHSLNKKGNKMDLNNYSGIFLIIITYNILLKPIKLESRKTTVSTIGRIQRKVQERALALNRL